MAATVPVDIGQILTIGLTEGQQSFFEFDIPKEGVTISLRRQEGRMTLFASDKIQNPNSAFYDYRIDNEGEIYIDSLSLFLNKYQKRQSSEALLNLTLYVSVEGTGTDEINNFQLWTSKGDTIISK